MHAAYWFKRISATSVLNMRLPVLDVARVQGICQEAFSIDYFWCLICLDWSRLFSGQLNVVFSPIEGLINSLHVF